MRFYLKLFLTVGSFMCLVSATGRRMTGNLAFEARVLFVFTFGSDADRERLIEDMGRMRAIEGGYLEEYLSRERFVQESTRYAQGSDPNDPDTATPEEETPEEDSIDEVGSPFSIMRAVVSETSNPTRPMRSRVRWAYCFWAPEPVNRLNRSMLGVSIRDN